MEMKGILRDIMELHGEMFIGLHRLENLEGRNLQVEKVHNLKELRYIVLQSVSLRIGPMPIRLTNCPVSGSYDFFF